MESRKREAESELDRDHQDERNFSHDKSTEKWPEASPEEIESRRIVKVSNLPPNKDEIHVNPFLTTTFPSAFTNISDEPFKAGFGFQSYSNINPFAAIKPSFSSTQLGSSAFTDSSSSISVNESSTTATTTATAPASTILIPSPKSHNPFSTPSPVQNPFMSFIDNKTATAAAISNPWAAATTSTSSLGTGGFSSISKSPTIQFPIGSGNIITNTMATSTTNNTDTKIENKADDAEDNGNDQNNDDNVEEEETYSGVYGKIYQLPDNVVVVTGEEEEECILQMRVKLYKLQARSSIGSNIATPITNAASTESSMTKVSETTIIDKESVLSDTVSNSKTTTIQPQVDWVEVGVGPIKILRKGITTAASSSSTSASTVTGMNSNDDNIINKNIESKSENIGGVDIISGSNNNDDIFNKKTKQQQSHRLVLRRESNRGGPGTKLLLNIALKSYVTIVKAGDKMFRLSCMGLKDESSSECVLCTYLFKTSSNQDSENLFNTIKNAIDSCSSSNNSNSNTSHANNNSAVELSQTATGSNTA